MGNHFRPYHPEQSFLFPPSPLDWLPEGHLAYFVLEVVGTLDLKAIEDVHAKRDARGEHAYSPRMLLAVLVYGYCVGVFSSRKLARALYEDVAFGVLSGGEHPHFTRISDFRLEHREALAGLFVQVLKLCQRAGLVKFGHVALDGTKILANASKHKAMSYERMQKEEVRLRAEVDALLAKAEATDGTEDARHGAGQVEKDLPAELERRESRLEKIKQAKRELEQEAVAARAAELRKNAQAQDHQADNGAFDAQHKSAAKTHAKKAREQANKLDGRSDDDDEPKGGAGVAQLPTHRVQHERDGKPAPKAQRNFTDPESRIMVTGGVFVQAYNAQAMVDAHAQVIVAVALTNQPADAEHLPAMLELGLRNTGTLPKRFSADAGYFSENNAAQCEQLGVDAYLAVKRTKHGTHAEQPPTNNDRATTAKEKMQAKLATKEGRAIYARRKVIAEPPFGQIKSAQGFRRFSLRGLQKVRCEWSLVCATHNLLKLFRSGLRPPAFA